MFKKLQSLYPNAELFTVPPQHSDMHFIFLDRTKNEWIGIPRKDVSQKEFNILKVFFDLEESDKPATSPLNQSWYEFLFLNGQPPDYPLTNIRLIQFQIMGNEFDQSEIEAALKGFFSNKILIIWENSQNGIVIEIQKHLPLSEKELISMTETFESDFYVNISFYIGKEYPYSDLLPNYFWDEREYFIYGQKYLAPVKTFTFERVFPSYLASNLSENIKGKLNKTIFEIFKEDPEMFLTLKVFLENNLNVSLTAKKLYIHRNTLQYRIDKFTEKTGIPLKNFHGAFTVFLSCLIFELDNHT